MQSLQKLCSFATTALLLTACSVIGAQPAHAEDKPQPYSVECNIDVLGILGQVDCQLPIVPAGKRFVIETVSGSLQLGKGIKPVFIDLHTTTGGVTTDNILPSTFQGTTVFYPGDYYTVYQQVRLSEDGGTLPFFNLILSNSSPGATGFFTAAGYLVDCP